MKITYDAEVDALYIRLLDGPRQCRTLRLNDDVSLNVGKSEALVGIEILNATEVLGRGELPTVVLENLPSASAGLKTVLRDIKRRRKPPMSKKTQTPA